MGHHPDRYASIVDVCVLLQRADRRMLLAERANTGFSDGQLGIPGGRLEAGESVAAGAARELAEEAGVVMDPAELELLYVAHHTGGAWGARLGFFFGTSSWSGEPDNREPQLCAGLHWADPADLPDKTVRYVAAVLADIRAGKTFSMHGW
ncbi:MAG TPA: NUDIX domain-containing protein [Streptosporangiaceae bacterium]|jgi:8-oxo-dGTP diphosphatase